MIRYYLASPADAPWSRLKLAAGLSAAVALANDGVRELTITPAGLLCVNITGAALAGNGALHFQLEVADNPSFTNPLVSAFTSDSVTGWQFFNGELVQAFPAEGLPAQYRDAQFGNVMFVWTGAVPGQVYYVRTRGWDGAQWGEYRVACGQSVLTTSAPHETDPVFAASEAALFVAGDKAKLDSALQPADVADVPRLVAVPASATAPGTAGQIAANATHLYVCVAANTWRRVALEAWS